MTMTGSDNSTGQATGPAIPWWRDAKVTMALQIMLLIGLSGVAAVGKRIHPSMAIPGSSAVFWLAPLLAARLAVKRDGAGTFAGLCVAAWGIPIGLGHTFGYNAALYGATGLTLDLAARLPRVNIRHVIGAVVCGLLAHMAKFAFITVAAAMSPATKHFLIVGLLNSALLHAAFGIASGLIGYGLFKVGERALDRSEPPCASGKY
ncbi:MAG: hypothetical protein NTU41_04310 [Chloroflexi bacterium]|nr:hypothetical protein [Chloroflexota bacterium]